MSVKKCDKSLLRLPEQISPDLAYLTGVFAGDGSLNFRDSKKEYSLKCVGNPLDEKEFYIQIVAPKFKNVFGFSPVIKLFDTQTTFGFRIFSKALVNYLTQKMDLPLGSKYSRLRIPSSLISDKRLTRLFIRGLFDTDGCISFKRRYRENPYYPVISFSSKSEQFVREIADFLKEEGFKISERYSYRVKDSRISAGFTTISRIELNGRDNLKLWLEKMGFSSPKHLEKIRKNWNGN